MTNIEFNRGSIDASGCVGNAWELVKQNYWMYVGITLLAFIISSYLYCISWVLMGPVMAGVFYVVLRQLRGEPIDFGMMFKGFEKFVPLMIIGLLQSIPDIIAMILSFTLNIGQLFMMPRGRGGNVQFLQSTGPNPFALAGGLLVMILLVTLAFMIFSVAWKAVFFFAIPLALEHNLSPIEAIKLSARASMANIGGLIVLFIFEFLIVLLGVVMICFGLIFISLPLVYVTNAFVYRQVFPLIEQNFNLDPPPPTTYGSTLGLGR